MYAVGLNDIKLSAKVAASAFAVWTSVGLSLLPEDGLGQALEPKDSAVGRSGFKIGVVAILRLHPGGNWTFGHQRSPNFDGAGL